MTLTRQTTRTSNEKNYQKRSVFQPHLVVLYWPCGYTATWANASSAASGRDQPVSLNDKLGKRELCTRSLMPAQWQHKGSTKLEHDTPVGQQCHVTWPMHLATARSCIYNDYEWHLPQTALFCKFWVALLTFVTDETRHFIFSTQTELVSASLCEWQIASKRELIWVM